MIYLISGIIILILILIYVYVRHFTADLSVIGKMILSLCIILFAGAIILNPEESYASALDGLKIWFNIVCPSLLPFFIGAELLVNSGMVNFIGALLEPVMRPLFNVPGCGSFPFVMSITSGYPVGSKIVAELYNKKLCSKTEAQRLLSFCSTSGPLFMLGAVGIGMLHNKYYGVIIALSHYLGAITVGLIFRFYKSKDTGKATNNKTSIKDAVKKLLKYYADDKRPVGFLLSDAVKNSVNSILTVGGFIIIFSVIIRLLILSHITDALSSWLYAIFHSTGINRQIITPIVSGFFEITVGSKLISSSHAILYQKIAAISGIISWSGLSIIAQTAGMISNTDLNLKVYVFCKFLHSIFSSIYALLLINYTNMPYISNIISVFGQNKYQYDSGLWINNLIFYTGRFLNITLLLLVFSIAINIIRHWMRESKS